MGGLCLFVFAAFDSTHSTHTPYIQSAAESDQEEEEVMDTDGGEAGKRTRAGEGAAEGATAGRAAAALKEGRDNLQFEDPFEGTVRCGSYYVCVYPRVDLMEYSHCCTDEYESEEEVDAGDDDDDEEEEGGMDVEDGGAAAAGAASGKKGAADAMEEDEEPRESSLSSVGCRDVGETDMAQFRSR